MLISREVAGTHLRNEGPWVGAVPTPLFPAWFPAEPVETPGRAPFSCEMPLWATGWGLGVERESDVVGRQWKGRVLKSIDPS